MTQKTNIFSPSGIRAQGFVVVIVLYRKKFGIKQEQVTQRKLTLGLIVQVGLVFVCSHIPNSNSSCTKTKILHLSVCFMFLKIIF